MINIFSKNLQALTIDVDMYIVKWTTYTRGLNGSVEYPRVKQCYQAFTNKDEAYAFAKALNDSIIMLGITSLPEALVYKQKTATL